MKAEEAGRIFENNLLENLSRAHPVLNTAVALALAAFCAAQVRFASVGAPGSVAIIVFVAFGWTLFEYTMHRFVFHWRPKSAALARMMYLVHAYHHDYPNERSRNMFPLVVSLPIVLAIWLVMLVFLTRDVSLLALSVFIFMFAVYDLVHYLHHVPTRFMPALRRRHMLHHFRDHDANFGVTTNLWDRVFGTLRREAPLQPGVDEGSSSSAT